MNIGVVAVDGSRCRQTQETEMKSVSSYRTRITRYLLVIALAGFMGLGFVTNAKAVRVVCDAICDGSYDVIAGSLLTEPIDAMFTLEGGLLVDWMWTDASRIPSLETPIPSQPITWRLRCPSGMSASTPCSTPWTTDFSSSLSIRRRRRDSRDKRGGDDLRSVHYHP